MFVAVGFGELDTFVVLRNRQSVLGTDLVVGVVGSDCLSECRH